MRKNFISQGKHLNEQVHWEEWKYKRNEVKKYRMVNDLRNETLHVLFNEYTEK